jgi:hypothetical protein
MNPKIRIATIALLTILGPISISRADGLPWAFYAPRAEGYTIELVSIEPAPGTPLIRGSEVTITASMTYKLTIAPRGTITFVPQDERNRPVGPPDARAQQVVEAPQGALTLQQTLTIPRNAKELRLFIPLFPDGLTKTTGEITVRYPIGR